MFLTEDATIYSHVDNLQHVIFQSFFCFNKLQRHYDVVGNGEGDGYNLNKNK